MPNLSKKVLILLALLTLSFSGKSWAEVSSSEKAAVILEQNTSFHWGKDCLVWIVHYPDELVEPWADSDASARGLSPEEKAEYIKSFRSQLRIDDSEPFLVTVYHFGPKPLVLSPLGGNLSMTTQSGQALAPLSYEKKLDQPISGIVQGLVFFPKQEGPFSLAMKGLGIYQEQIFYFSGLASSPKIVKAPEEEVKSRIVELPPVEPIKPKAKEPESEAEKPLAPAASETEPPAWLGPGPALLEDQTEDLKPQSRLNEGLSPDLPYEFDISQDILSETGESRDEVLEKFLGLWAKGDADGMFQMLHSSSKAAGIEAFRKKANSSALRWCLSSGYKVKWLDGQRAKVFAPQRLLLIRVLQSETIGILQEDGRLTVVW